MKNLDYGTLLFKCKNHGLKDKIYTYLVTFDVKEESLHAICRFNKELNIFSPLSALI